MSRRTRGFWYFDEFVIEEVFQCMREVWILENGVRRTGMNVIGEDFSA